MATQSGSPYGDIALELDGNLAGRLRRVQPPGYEANPFAASTDEPFVASRAGRFTLTPADADFDLVGPGPLLDWALTLPRKVPVANDGAIQLLDTNLRAVRRIEWRRVCRSNCGCPNSMRQRSRPSRSA